MDLYIAGCLTAQSMTERMLQDKGVKNRLLTYHEFDIRVWKEWLKLDDRKFFVDSGAFSVHNSGASIDINKYMDFLKKYHPRLTLYASLDVIGDWKASAQNDFVMRENGLNPLATFHSGSPLHELDRMCREFDYIALGGLVPLALRRNVMVEWLDKCWDVIKNHWPVKVHGYGVTSQFLLERYPFYSVDSSSSIMTCAMGRVMRFKNGKMSNYKTSYKPHPHLEFVDIKTPDIKKHLERKLQNSKEQLKLAKHVTELWSARGITWD